MEHRSYPKITVRIDPAAVSTARVWVATEKIHGAQLVVATDGVTVRIGKRKAWLADGEPFFGWQLLRAELDASARALHRELARPGIVRLYGEIFGGSYPHPDVPAMPGASAVQTGIHYAPDVRFAAFDALVEQPGGWIGASGDVRSTLVAHSALSRLAERVGLMMVPLLARGPRAELDRLPVRFPSRIPALLGLPPVDENWAEGLVIKPDAEFAPEARPALKRKIPEFDEQKFDESLPWSSDARLGLSELRALGKRLINPARVASARSKVGDSDPRALSEEIVLDVLVDLEGAFPRAIRELDDATEATLRDELTRLAISELSAPVARNTASS